MVAHSRYQTVGRRGQRDAQQLLLAELSTQLHVEGVDHLIIESVDDVTNGRDKRTLLDQFEPGGGVPFVYDWRSKSERVFWVGPRPARRGTREPASARLEPAQRCPARRAFAGAGAR